MAPGSEGVLCAFCRQPARSGKWEIVLMLSHTCPAYLPPPWCTDATLPLMLDAVAGFVVKRIRARHVNAVAKPRDVAAILRAYTTLRHKCVVWAGGGGTWPPS